MGTRSIDKDISTRLAVQIERPVADGKVHRTRSCTAPDPDRVSIEHRAGRFADPAGVPPKITSVLMGQRDSRAPGRRGADHTREHHPRGAGGHREGVTEAAAYLADAQEAADCRPMRIRSLCRSLRAQRPYFTGDSGCMSQSRKPVRVFRSDGGSNPPLSVFPP